MPHRFASLPLILMAATAAQAQVQVPPVPPAAPAFGPSLWFNPADVPALQQRRQDPLVSSHYARVKSFVDGRATANFGALSDDVLSRIAKGAALLHQMGETRSGVSYRDLARDAIVAIDDRTPPNVFGIGGNLQTQYDCGRLQSMAEARDMLVGTGLTSADQAAIDRKIADWAEAFTQDVTLSFRQNNLGIKAGSALVTAGLALSGDARSAGWIAEGVRLINDGLRVMGSSSGYYLEGPHYLNYTLNNLVPAAYHVRNKTGADWFAALRPLVEASLALRSPSGEFVPYEDAVSAVFPGLYLAGAYAGDPLAGELMWAWANGAHQNASSFGNQQLVDATAFLVGDPGVAPTPPARATTFLTGDAHLSSLRSGLDPDAVQACMLTARDYSNLTLINSRHNLPNPLAIAVSGLGDDMLVTGSGGPELTRSSNRVAYLQASNHNTVLVDGQAPFTVGAGDATTDLRLDSEPEGGLPHGFFDGARTEVHVYPNARRVRRTLGLVDGSYAVVLDEVELTRSAQIELPFRGRGQRQALWTTGAVLGATWTLPAQASGRQTALDLASASSAPASLTQQGGTYAPRWGQEEQLQTVRVEARASATHVVTVLAPRLSTDAPLAVVARSQGGAAALEVFTPSATDTIAAGPSGSIQGVGPIDATDAEWAIVRESGGSLGGLAVAGATSLTVRGKQVLSASAPVSLAATPSAGGLVVTFSSEGGPAQVELRGLVTGANGALWNGQPLIGFQQSGDAISFPVPAGGGTLRVEAGAGSAGPIGSTQPGSTAAPTAGSGGGSSGGGCQLSPASGQGSWLALVLTLLTLGVLRLKR